MSVEKLNFAIVGYGRMGKLLEEVLIERNENLAMIIEPSAVTTTRSKTIVMDEISAKSMNGVDTAICFTSPEAGYETTKALLSAGKDTVVATTKFYMKADGGVNQEMIEEFRRLAVANNCRMLYGSNFSVGMNSIFFHLEAFAKTMHEMGYDVAVEERHHIGKGDYSGSANTLVTILRAAYSDRPNVNRGGDQRKRANDEITVTATRVGRVPGTHTIIFDSPVDTIELTHTVRDPKVFPSGAVNLAYKLRDMPPGAYHVQDLFKQR